MNPAPDALPGGPVSHAIARLARIHQLLAGRLLRELGLHPSQELLLMRLWEAGPQRQNCLAAELGTDSAGTTRIVQRLEAAGYVRRDRDPRDERTLAIALTDSGRALRERAERIPAGIVEHLGLPLEELLALQRALTRVNAAAQAALTREVPA